MKVNMIVLRPIELMNILQTVIGIQMTVRHTSGPLPSELVQSLGEAAKTIDEIAENLELPVTGTTARNMLARADTSKKI